MNKPGAWNCPMCGSDFTIEQLQYYSIADRQPIREPLFTGYDGPDPTELKLWLLGVFLLGLLLGQYTGFI